MTATFPADAPCSGATGIFFYTPADHATHAAYQRSVADRYCARCPYTAECEDLYQSFYPPPSGVWANKTEADRKAMR